MADIEQFGIEAVIKGLSNFLGGMDKINQALGKSGTTSQRVTQELERMGLRFNTAAKRWQDMNSQSKQFVSHMDVIIRLAQRANANFDQMDRVAGRTIEDLTGNIKQFAQGFAEGSLNLEGFLQLVESMANEADDIEQLGEAFEEVIPSSFSQDVQAASSELGKLLSGVVNFVTAAGLSIPILAKMASFIAAISKVALPLGLLITALAVAFKVLQAALIPIQVGLKLFQGGIGLVQRALQALLSPIRNALAELNRLWDTARAVAFGVLVRDVIRNIIREMREMVQSGLEAVKMFQTLEIRLENFAARALRAADETLGIEDSFRLAETRAQGLLKWIKDLSLIAPFGTDVIAKTLSLNLAMGFTEQQAKDLTFAIAEYTAGMGLSNDVMERIVFNFGQMKAAGKVTATEMRDLARGAFFPLTEILDIAAKNLGVATTSIQEFREQAAAGEIPVEAFFEAFVEFTERDFPGAMVRFSRTLEGVTIRAGNFIKTIVGLELLGPIAKRFAESAANALDKIMTPAVQEAAFWIGQVLGRSFDVVSAGLTDHFFPALRKVAEALGLTNFSLEKLMFTLAFVAIAMNRGIRGISKVIESIVTFLQNTFRNIQNAADSWGYNIISALASGMAGAARLVIKIIVGIANIIADLLSPGSPPKILPELPEWGMAAMAEFLKGFTLADFDILEGIQGPLKDILDILEETGQIGENQAGKIFANLSKDIAEALATGTISDELFGRIASAGGPFGQELAELARRQVELAAATEAVRLAEERLDNARKREEAAFVKRNAKVREYNALVRAGADPDILKAKLAEVNAAEKAAFAAHAETIAAEEALEVAEEEQDAAEEKLTLQEKLLQQLIELTRAQIVRPETDTGGGGEEGAEEPGEPSLPEFPGVDTGLPSPEEIRKKLNDIFSEAAKAVDEWIARLRKKAEGFLGIFQPLIDAAGRVWEAFKTFYDERIRPILDRFRKWWDENGPIIRERIAGVWNFAAAVVLTAWEIIKETWDNFTTRLEELGLDSETFGITWEDVWNTAKAVFFQVMFAILGGIILFSLIVTGTLGGVAAVVLNVLQAWQTFKEGFDLVVQGVMLVLTGLGLLATAIFENDLDPAKRFAAWSAGWTLLKIGAQSIVNGMWKIIKSVFKASLGSIIAFIAGFATNVIKFFEKIRDKVVGKSIIPEMMDKIETVIKDKFDAVKKFIFDTWNSIVGKFDEVKNKIITFINTALTNLKNYVSTTLSTAINNFKNNVLTPIKNFISGVFTSAINTLRTGPLESLKGFIATTLGPAWSNLKNNVMTPVKDFISGTFTSTVNTLKNTTLGQLATYLTGTAKTAWVIFKNDGLKAAADYASGTLTNVINTLKNGPLTDLATKVSTALTNAFNNFRTGPFASFTSALSSAFTPINNLLGWLGGLISKLETAWNWLTKVTNAPQPAPTPPSGGGGGGGAGGGGGGGGGSVPTARGLNFKVPMGFAGDRFPLNLGLTSGERVFVIPRNLVRAMEMNMTSMSAALTSPPMMSAPAMSAGMAGNNVNVNMGGVSITSPMTEALFEAKVRNVIKKSIR